MSATFHEVRFPTDISYGSSGGPEFCTDVVVLGGGHEKRDDQWEYPLERWDVAYGVREKAQLTSLLAFFYARRGRAIGFRFKSTDDYTAVEQECIEIDATHFQLTKTYTSGEGSLARKITKPVAGTVTVYVDSVEADSGWSVDTATGIVTFEAPVASGSTVTADCEFDIPVRFDTDHLPVNFADYEARSASVPIKEIRQ